MPSVLETPELLNLIFAHFQLQHLVYVKSVCREWCRIARRTLTSPEWLLTDPINGMCMTESIQVNFFPNGAAHLPMHVVVHPYDKQDVDSNLSRQKWPMVRGVLHEIRVQRTPGLAAALGAAHSEMLVWNHPTRMVYRGQQLDVLGFRLEVPGIGVLTTLLEVRRLLATFPSMPGSMKHRDVVWDHFTPHPLDCIFPAVVLPGLTTILFDEDFQDMSILSMCLAVVPPEIVTTTAI